LNHQEVTDILDLKETISQLFLSYGYIVLYLYFTIDTLGIILPSKSVLSFFGILIDKNILEFFPVLITAVSGSITGVSLSYLIGTKIGRPGLEKYGRYISLKPEK
jgi:membrane protein DedA with SNARE-associated domain